MPRRVRACRGDAVRDLLDPRLRGGQGSYGTSGTASEASCGVAVTLLPHCHGTRAFDPDCETTHYGGRVTSATSSPGRPHVTGDLIERRNRALRRRRPAVLSRAGGGLGHSTLPDASVRRGDRADSAQWVRACRWIDVSRNRTHVGCAVGRRRQLRARRAQAFRIQVQVQRRHRHHFRGVHHALVTD